MASRSRKVPMHKGADADEEREHDMSMLELLAARRSGVSIHGASHKRAEPIAHAGHKRARDTSAAHEAGVHHTSASARVGGDVDDASDEEEEEEDDAAPAAIRKRSRRKHAPVEMSSTRPVSRNRLAVATSEYKPRDPRFEETSGELKRDLFERSYAFLDEYRATEVAALQAAVKAEKSSIKRGEMMDLLHILRQQQGERARGLAVAATLQAHKREEAAAVAAGKQPFYLKRRDKKALSVVARYKQLEGSSGASTRAASGGDGGGQARVDAALKRKRMKLLSRSR